VSLPLHDPHHLTQHKVAKAAGADECVDYKQEQDAVISEIIEKTGGVMYRAFDAVGKSWQIATPMFQAINGPGQRFTTTNER
jgi:threonine dehydrogenase-like Zn-dependent dehydrogenase